MSLFSSPSAALLIVVEMQTGSGFIRFAIRYTTAGRGLSYLPYLTKDTVFPVLAMHILLNLPHCSLLEVSLPFPTGTNNAGTVARYHRQEVACIT